jgi:ATP-binding protein involved in chromosome partitioning
VRFPVENHPLLGTLIGRLESATRQFDERLVDVAIVPMDEPDIEALEQRLRAIGASNGKAGRVLSIASGKGGVGKSTITVNLAVALSQLGHTVGLLDADIYGFSVPRMLGADTDPIVVGNTVVPSVAHGVRCVSMGFFIEERRAVIWRGPMLHKALDQFVNDVHWGSPEFLLIDTPPGTGDVAMSVAQHLPGSELYVVTTPQPAAQRVAQRSGALGRELKLPIRGVIENMSAFAAPDGTVFELFGSGGGAALAADLGVELLAQIPFDPAARRGADDGRPAALIDQHGEMAQAFDALALRVIDLGPARIYRRELRVT